MIMVHGELEKLHRRSCTRSDGEAKKSITRKKDRTWTAPVSGTKATAPDPKKNLAW